MTKKLRPKTISEYIAAAPPAGRSHLRRLHALLEKVAPKAEQTIKWGTPFFVEPRFLFAFSAHKAHLGFAPSAEALDAFRKELSDYQTTRYVLKVRYDETLPEGLIQKIAKYQLRAVKARQTDTFW